MRTRVPPVVSASMYVFSLSIASSSIPAALKSRSAM